MLTRASMCRDVGGFTETMPSAYTDIDYCLKLREIGAYSVFAPASELIHGVHMSDQLRETSRSEKEHFASRWARLVTDPFYNEQELAGIDSPLELGPNRPLG